MQPEIQQEKGTRLYGYQQRDIQVIFEKLASSGPRFRLLYQLPTGGGKTVVFAEIGRRFIETYNKKVLVLTHRTELSLQTARTLKNAGIRNRILNSSSERTHNRDCDCHVAMVETLKNRFKNKAAQIHQLGLVIVDEAHHNSFKKLLGKFPDAVIIGVTATPLSSDKNLPLNESYDELLLGESIPSLISQGFLAKARTIDPRVELNSLTTGLTGDFTIGSSDALYSSPAFLKLLLENYEKYSLNKKTLIFNAGILASKSVCEYFKQAGYEIKHLDNRTAAAERKEILAWFKKTKNAILTSVSLLTTGFDEPSIQTVILNRATTSITLFFQMVGRGSRKMANKKTFTLIDLGNNVSRFGHWEEMVDWEFIFKNPERYAQQLQLQLSQSKTQNISPELRQKFPNSLETGFDLEAAFFEADKNQEPHKNVIRESVRQHAQMCIENSESISEALKLADALQPEIVKRVKSYAALLEKSTKSYRDWLLEDYNRRLQGLIARLFDKSKIVALAG